MMPRLRLATTADLPAITLIYNQAIRRGGQTAALQAVDEAERAAWLSRHDARYPVFVLEHQDEIIGWLSFSPHRPGRSALRYTAEISYYLHQDWQGRRLGDELIRQAIRTGRALGFKSLFAILLDTNQASVRLLEKHGFARWGHLPNIADLDGQECGQYYYGRRIQD
jgi:phosphinothricin acetyltransferase